MNHIEPISTTVAVAAVPKVAEIVNKVGGAVTRIASKVGIGGVTQDRFIARTLEVDKDFDAAGYFGPPSPYQKGELFTKYKLRKTQVTDRKVNGNYEPEFARLHAYIVERMNIYNPGLGDVWKQYFPAFEMANLGNIKSSGALAAFKEFVKAYPPGKFDPSLAVPDPRNPIVDKSALIEAKEATGTTPGLALAGFGNMKGIGLIVAIIILLILFGNLKK